MSDWRRLDPTSARDQLAALGVEAGDVDEERVAELLAMVLKMIAATVALLADLNGTAPPPPILKDALRKLMVCVNRDFMPEFRRQSGTLH